MSKFTPYKKILNDDCLVVLDKIAKLLVQPSPKREKVTLTSLLETDIKQKVYPCHRLDRETTGLIIYAKSQPAQREIMEQFKRAAVKKKYFALVKGRLIKSKGFLESYIIDREGKRFKEKPKIAKTKYKVIRNYHGFSLVELEPLTGRTNQIRIQLAKINHPILGERKYALGKDFKVKFRRVALHAFFISFNHPQTKKKISLEIDLAKDLKLDDNSLAVCAKIEADLADLDEPEAKKYLQELGIKKSGLDNLITASYKLLNLVTFLTTGPEETRAWTVVNGSKAPQAAGVIHTDFERGFIRAEVINWEELLSSGGWTQAKEKGLTTMKTMTPSQIRNILATTILAMLIAGTSTAAPISYSGGTYSQNFDSLIDGPGDGSTATWNDGTTVPGWYASVSLLTGGNYLATDGRADHRGEVLVEMMASDNIIVKEAVLRSFDRVMSAIAPMLTHAGQEVIRFTVDQAVHSPDKLIAILQQAHRNCL